MNLNLTSLISLDIEIISRILVQAGMEHVDDMFFELFDKTQIIETNSGLSPSEWDVEQNGPYIEKSYKSLFLISLSPRLLNYSFQYRPGRSEQTVITDEVNTIWVGCKVTVFPDEDLSAKADLVKSFADSLPFKPFKDEDAYKGIFKKITHKGFTDLIFYINPDYPTGWWQNHTL